MDRVHDVTLGAVTLKQVSRVDHSPNVTVARADASGQATTSEFHVTSGEPETRITNHDLAGALAGLPPTTGLSIAAGSIVVPWKKDAHNGTHASGAAHVTLTGADAFAYIDEISASHNDEVGVSITHALCWLSTDGVTAPIAENVNQSLSAAAFNRSYSLGKVVLDPTGAGAAAELPYIQSVSIRPGFTVEKKKWGGMVYPVTTRVVTIRPEMRFTFEDFDSVDDWTSLFSSLAACTVYFQRRTNHGTLVSAATEEHVSFAFGSCLAVTESVSASEKQNGQGTIVVHGLTLTVGDDVAIP